MKIGSTNINSVRVGSGVVSKVYVGSQLVWQPPPPP